MERILFQNERGFGEKYLFIFFLMTQQSNMDL
jgi:hypothetical protein